MKIELKIGINEEGQRLDRFIRKLFNSVELSTIFRDIRKGNIRVNKKVKDISYKLQEGDELRIFGYHYSIENKSNEIEEMKYDDELYIRPKVCFEDENLLVVIKDLDTLTHSNGEDGVKDLTKSIKVYLAKKGDYTVEKGMTFSPSPVNRLDRNTYGLVMFGKNNKSLNELNEIVRNRYVSKYYQALIEGKIKDGIYRAYILKDHKTNKSRVSLERNEHSKEVEMEIKMLDTNGVVSLIEIKLITGRSHQIRSHLRFLGNPIVGDSKYGNKELRSFLFNKYGVENQLLFAYKLHFNGINEDMIMSYLNNKTILMAFPQQFKRMVKQEFKITV